MFQHRRSTDVTTRSKRPNYTSARVIGNSLGHDILKFTTFEKWIVSYKLMLDCVSYFLSGFADGIGSFVGDFLDLVGGLVLGALLSEDRLLG
jgi:hypothetical protein